MQKALNPILTGFHADPSMIRVNEYYYIANSTFEWYPGVEISRSKDLVNWETLPSPLSEKRLLDMNGENSSSGVWAPCLSYSDGMFWLIYTDMKLWNHGPWKDSPNYLTTAKNIEGPWSDPIYMNSSGFDPSLFHDDDGKKWFVNMEWDYRKPQTGAPQFTGILVQEYDHSQKKLVGPVTKIFLGTEIGLVEAPHIYKRNGFYYLMTAEGGTSYEHACTLARSSSLTGPYVVHPDNPLITAYGKDTYIKKAGHASMCDSEDGRTFLAYLCGRPITGTKACVLGRETSIAELVWINDWPYIKSDEIFTNGIANNVPQDTFEPPIPVANLEINRSKTYLFNTDKFDHDFKTLRIPRTEENYSLKKRPGFLRLTGGKSPMCNFDQTLLAVRQTDFSFSAETKIEFDPTYYQEMAGLVWRYDEDNQYLLLVTHDEEQGRILKVITIIAGQFEHSYVNIPLKDGPVFLGLTVEERWGRFRYSYDGKAWAEVRPILDASVLSDDFNALGFTGAFIGLFCADTARYQAVADFEFLKYEVK